MDSEKLKEIRLEGSWLRELESEFRKDYMFALKSFLVNEKRKGKKIYPKGSEIFKALDSTPLNKVKVVILGQDPYHRPGQAHGLSFSVPHGVEIPPSLKNIFKELENDLGISPPKSGCLIPWAEQGVLLLNCILSVEQGVAGSHSSKGWERFTDSIISKLNQKDSIVFILWGKYADEKGKSIDTSKHLVLSSAHPSPFSAHQGFFGGKHFSQCNDYLQSKGLSPIIWQI